MSDLLGVLLSTLLILAVGLSLAFAIAVFMYTDRSKLNEIEKNTLCYWWDKEILFKSAVSGKGQTLWALSRLHKYGSIYFIIYVVIGLFVGVIRSL
jgi:hypothetical protein